MSPPQFSDLGKAAKDLFKKGYNYGFVKIDVRTRTKNEVDFNFTSERNVDMQKHLATLESKFKLPYYGLSLCEKFNTDNVFRGELALEDQLIKGLKIDINTTYSPIIRTKNSLVLKLSYVYKNKSLNVRANYSIGDPKRRRYLKTIYKNETFHLNIDYDCSSGGSVLNISLVFLHQNWFFGLQSSIDTKKFRSIQNNYAIVYQTNNFILHTNLNNKSEIAISLCKKFNSKLDMGVSLSSPYENKTILFAFASKYLINKSVTFQAKINSLCQIGFSYSHKLKDGIKLTISTLIDGKNINGGGHKLGFGFELNV